CSVPPPRTPPPPARAVVFDYYTGGPGRGLTESGAPRGDAGTGARVVSGGRLLRPPAGGAHPGRAAARKGGMPLDENEKRNHPQHSVRKATLQAQTRGHG